MSECSRCDGEVEGRFRFCPWCGTAQRTKLVEFFHASPVEGQDRGKTLRVSAYLGDPLHVRFSIWSGEGEARSAMSLDPDEARRLVRFVEDATACEIAADDTLTRQRPSYP